MATPAPAKPSAQKKATKKKTAKKASKKTSKKASPKPKVEKINYLHIIVQFLGGDLNVVRKFIHDNNINASVVRRAAKEIMQTHPKQGELFAAWVRKEYPTGRGKTAPTLGEVRTFKGQQVKTKGKDGKPDKDGPVFNRIPLDAIGIEKGQISVVEFNGADKNPPPRPKVPHIIIYKKPGQD